MITGNEPINVLPYRDRAIETQIGLTIRQYYAGLAMQGIVSNETWTGNVNNTAIDSVRIADALIAELNKEKP